MLIFKKKEKLTVLQNWEKMKIKFKNYTLSVIDYFGKHSHGLSNFWEDWIRETAFYLVE